MIDPRIGTNNTNTIRQNFCVESYKMSSFEIMMIAARSRKLIIKNFKTQLYFIIITPLPSTQTKMPIENYTLPTLL